MGVPRLRARLAGWSVVTVTLEPPLTRSAPHWNSDFRETVLRTGPALVRTRGMGRWHRTRSGVHLTRPWGPVTSYHVWCGQHVSDSTKPRRGAVASMVSLDTLPDDGVPLCGTCEGRAIGAGHPGIAVQVTAPAGLLFEPDRLTPPKLCPSVGTRSYATPLWQSLDSNHRLAKCLACGNTEPLRGRSDGAGSWAVIARHEPGPDLTPGCPRHAWRHLVPYGGHAICACALPGGDA